MARKGVAVSQIILLVLGILVLAVVAYLLYTNFVQTGTTISAETCRAEATRICTGCTIALVPDKTKCDYTSKNMVTCINNNHVKGTVADSTKSTGIIDCTVITGGGTGAVVSDSGGASLEETCGNVKKSDALATCVSKKLTCKNNLWECEP